MELHQISNSNAHKGFTIFELIVVIALITAVGAASFSFGLPALGSIGCAQEKEIALVALHRARHAAQYLDWGNVSVRITEVGYAVVAHGNDILSEEEIEMYPFQTSVDVVSDEIVFRTESGELTRPVAHVYIGNEATMCREVITINSHGHIN